MTRTPEEWSAWWAEFKRRHGLTDETVKKLTEEFTPQVNVPTNVPKPWSDTEREEDETP